MSLLRILPLRIVLALAGLSILLSGVNIAFGGIVTLGLQGGTDFLAVTNGPVFAAHDSHVRFLGGVWIGIALVFFAAAVRLERVRPLLNLALGLIIIGGLARFTAARPDVLFGPDLIGPLAAELIGIPILWLWVSRTGRSGSARPSLAMAA